MASVAIIGGGRWARTIATVLAGLNAHPERLFMHARTNADDVTNWVYAQRLNDQITVCDDWPDYAVARPSAVIVANRAADHVAAARAALDAGIPVLVEKPLAIGADAVGGLLESAAQSNTLLAVSNVFLFARYMDVFVALTARHGRIHSLAVFWEDGRDEIVRGVKKKYDAGVTVLDDVLPHILPLSALITAHDAAFSSLRIAEGGAHVLIEAAANGIPLSISLVRNGQDRKRLLHVQTDRGIFRLDFSSEPARVVTPDSQQKMVDGPDGGLGPLAAMLTVFLKAAEGGILDSRLSPEKALPIAFFADQARASYRAQQQEWIKSRPRASPDAALAYALKEISLQR